jgi:peptidoglycan hydrolase CwlO-like protein
MSDPAKELNAAIRREIVELWTCAGRKHLAEAAKTDDLITCVGAIFAEIASLDEQLTTFGKQDELHDRIHDLEQQVKTGAAPYERQIEALNRRISELNEVAIVRALGE